MRGLDGGSQEFGANELFTDYEQTLFTRVVAIAERHGRTVKLLVLPAIDIFDAVAQTASQLSVAEIVVGESADLSSTAQAHLMGEAWDRTPHDRGRASQFVIHSPDGHVRRFLLGAHAPHLSAEDIDRIHRIWTEAVHAVGPAIHHRDVVAARSTASKTELRHSRDRAIGRWRHQQRIPQG